MGKLFIIKVLLTVVKLPVVYPLISLWKQPEDATLNFTGLASKYGYVLQEYDLTTEDGYILKLFRIPGNKKAVLLMHGLLDSADTFIIRGQDSLAVVLADEGYDVWLGNSRGNRYSRRHKWLDPNTDKQFWDFSFHEMAVIDLKTFIDFILNEANTNSLALIGHSQGNTLFYILGSIKPEYNDKIDIAIALGPVCYVNVGNHTPVLSTIIRMGSMLNRLLLNLNEEEMFGKRSLTTPFMNKVCTQRPFGYRVCGLGIFNALAGEDNEEFEPDFFYSLIGHFPTSTSRKNLLHLAQVAKRSEFAQFDNGQKKNIEVYNKTTSPLYNLTKVTMKTALLVGRNDKIIPLENVAILKKKLPNIVCYHEMERKKFNHIDYVWGKHMNKYLFPLVFKLLDKYSC